MVPKYKIKCENRDCGKFYLPRKGTNKWCPECIFVKSQQKLEGKMEDEIKSEITKAEEKQATEQPAAAEQQPQSEDLSFGQSEDGLTTLGVIDEAAEVKEPAAAEEEPSPKAKAKTAMDVLF